MNEVWNITFTVQSKEYRYYAKQSAVISVNSVCELRRSLASGVTQTRFSVGELLAAGASCATLSAEL